nr:MAG TPA: hypothetical protein [Caudoviricetes sp.]
MKSATNYTHTPLQKPLYFPFFWNASGFLFSIFYTLYNFFVYFIRFFFIFKRLKRRTERGKLIFRKATQEPFLGIIALSKR